MKLDLTNSSPQMVFHTATLMPNVKGDLKKSLDKKKMHIGNDYVAIVYNESGQPYNIGTVVCHFMYVVSIVTNLRSRGYH